MGPSASESFALEITVKSQPEYVFLPYKEEKNGVEEYSIEGEGEGDE